MMAWGARQPADLADTRTKIVRHDHELGLLVVREYAWNEYTQHRSTNFGRLLQEQHPWVDGATGQVRILPSLILIVPFLGVPLFWSVVDQNYGTAAITLVALDSTDSVDGHIVQRSNQVLTVGKSFNPVADRSALMVLHRVEGFGQQWILVSAQLLLAAGCALHLVAFYAYFTAAHRKYRLERAEQQSCPS